MSSHQILDEIILDRDGMEPLHQQLKNELLIRIESGRLAEGTKLPSEKVLAKSLDCSRDTVRRAYNELTDAHFIKVVPSHGRFVSRKIFWSLTSSSEQIRNAGKTPYTKLLDASTLRSPAAPLAQLLHLSTEQPVAFFRRQRFANNDTVAILESYLPLYLFPGIVEETRNGGGEASLYEIMRETYGHIPTHADVTFLARPADEHEQQIFSEKLNPAQGREGDSQELVSAVLVLRQTSFTTDGTVIEFTKMIHPQYSEFSLKSDLPGLVALHTDRSATRFDI